jgi:hypothetical protein
MKVAGAVTDKEAGPPKTFADTPLESCHVTAVMVWDETKNTRMPSNPLGSLIVNVAKVPAGVSNRPLMEELQVTVLPVKGDAD